MDDLLTKIIALLLFFGKIYAQPECISQNGSAGSCIELKECEILHQILSSKTRTEEETAFLRKSHCGFHGKNPKVCCPIDPTIAANASFSPCSTYRNERGRCVELVYCPKFALVSSTTLPLQIKETAEILSFFRVMEKDTNKFLCDCPSETAAHRTCLCCSDLRIHPTDEKGLLPKETFIPEVTKEAVHDLLPENCGKPNSDPPKKEKRINLPKIDQHPWNALIEYKNEWNTLIFGCGGTLISLRYVLTAGRCASGHYQNLFGTPFNARLGEFDRTWNDDEDCSVDSDLERMCNKPCSRIPIEKVIVHPDYDPNISQRNDIALLRLASEAPFTDFIRPACLPSFDFENSIPSDELLLAGWGISNAMKSTNIIFRAVVPFLPLPECQANYTKNRLWDKQMCVAYDTEKSCVGDPGGPLVYLHEGKFEVHGILSFGMFPCKNYEKPTVYTKVFSYLSWIYGNLEK